jgi:hypothetical protein
MNALLQHPAVLAIGTYWVFSALVGGMPEPDTSSSFLYRWAYSSFHILSGDLKNAVASRFPSAITVPAGADVQHTASETTTIITK